MPIKPIVLQRRHAELGRIRLGNKGDRGQPQKLERFRFTSPSETYIKDLAALYGGAPRPWNNNGKAEFEVFTDAATMPVIAVKGGLSQWMETWTGGGCVHRCDGEVNVLTGEACNPKDPAHKNAKPTTRLSVMLPELDAIGVWRLESHGWNAAAEIPAVAELAQYVGDLVPAVLHLVERRSVKEGKTSRFVVPVLDLRIGATRLREIAAEKSGLVEIAAPAGTGAPALEAPADDYTHFLAELEVAESLDALGDIWHQMRQDELVGPASEASARRDQFVAAFRARAEVLKAEEKPSEPQPDADGAYEAEIVPDADGGGEAGGSNADVPASGDADAVWQQILTVGGQQGMDLETLSDDFAQQMGGLSSNEASAAELTAYLQKLQAGVAA